MSSQAPDARQQRLFFALWPDPAVRMQLARLAESATAGHGRVVSAGNLHITLVFLGGVTAERRACAERAAAEVVGEAFELTLDTLGYFRRSQVAWVAPSRTPPALTGLAAALQNRLAGCGFEPEGRPFTPHLTLARKVRGAPRPVGFAPITWSVSGFSLIESFMLPGGVRYEPLGAWSLTGMEGRGSG